MRKQQLYISEFLVEGTGPFPVDMLRYDQCWPADAPSASSILEPIYVEGGGERPRKVIMRKVSETGVGPTVRRWESLTWRVIEINGIPCQKEARRG